MINGYNDTLTLKFQPDRQTAAAFCAALLLLAFPAGAHAQTALKGTINYHVEAREQALTGSDSPKLHWVLLSPPNPDDVDFSDPDARDRIRKAIRDIAANQGICQHFALERGSTCSYASALETRLRPEIGLSQLNMFRAPTAKGQTPDPLVRYEYKAAVRATVDSLEIIVQTDSSEAAQAEIISPSKLTWQEAAARLKKDRPPAEGASIPITIQYTAADRKKSTAGEFDAATIEDSLLGVGLMALDEANKGKCLPGSSAPSTAAMNSVQNNIVEQLSVSIAGWPHPDARFVSDRGKYTLRVRRLRIVSGIKVQILRGQIQGASGMVDFVGASAQIEKQLQANLDKAAADAQAAMKNQIDALVGHVPTPPALNAAHEQLRTSPLVSGAVDTQADGSQLVLTGTRRWSIGALNAKANLVGSFTPENFLTGQASLDGSNLLRIGETYNLNIQAGNEVQNMTLDFAIPRTRGKTWKLDYGLRHGLFYTRDWNQRFGNNRPDDAKLIFRQMGMSPAIYAEISRQPDNAFHWIFSTRMEASYDWRAVLIEPRIDKAPNLLDGQLSAPTISLKLLAGRDFTGVLGAVRLQADAAARRGTHALGGDYNFEQFTASAQGEAFFGPRQSNSDYFVRYQRGLGYSSAGTPLFELMRLGGTTSVRGIENGEFIGRHITYDQSSVGVRALALVNFFHHTAASPDHPKSAGFDPANIYVVSFYDRGRVLDRAHLGDLLPVGPAFHGYGFAGEVRQLPAGAKLANISLGWAKSPQSRLHRNGLMTVGVSFEF